MVDLNIKDHFYGTNIVDITNMKDEHRKLILESSTDELNELLKKATEEDMFFVVQGEPKIRDDYKLELVNVIVGSGIRIESPKGDDRLGDLKVFEKEISLTLDLGTLKDNTMESIMLHHYPSWRLLENVDLISRVVENPQPETERERYQFYKIAFASARMLSAAPIHTYLAFIKLRQQLNTAIGAVGVNKLTSKHDIRSTIGDKKFEQLRSKKDNTLLNKVAINVITEDIKGVSVSKDFLKGLRKVLVNDSVHDLLIPTIIQIARSHAETPLHPYVFKTLLDTLFILFYRNVPEYAITDSSEFSEFVIGISNGTLMRKQMDKVFNITDEELCNLDEKGLKNIEKDLNSKGV